MASEAGQVECISGAILDRGAEVSMQLNGDLNPLLMRRIKNVTN